MKSQEELAKTLIASRIPIQWNSGLPIYASETFLRSIATEYGWLGGIDPTGETCCILPYTIIKKAGFRFARFRVETVALRSEFDVLQEKVFLDSVVTYFRAAGVDVIIPGSNAAVFRTYPSGAVAAPYGTFIKDLNQPEEALFAEVHTDYRKKIRSAIKSGVEVTEGLQHLDVVYRIVADTLRRSGGGAVLKSYDDFKASLLGLGANVKVFVAEHEGVVQACLVAAFSDYGAYTFYGGTTDEPTKGAMHLVHWEAIRTFRALGVQRFNFQGVRIDPVAGSKQEGILTFKKRFGGRVVQGYTWKYSLSPLKATAYSVAVRLFSGGDLVDQERGKLAGR